MFEALCSNVTAVCLGVGLLTTVTARAEFDPGPDIPPVGRSLFDHVVHAPAAPGTAPQLDVPFPFAALLEHIRARLGTGASDSEADPIKVVLIPVGRSLQRHAAAPDFFRYPRLVAAVTGEAGDPAAPLLKDRLYLGYQELTGVIEVISYNESLGRFEFQILKNYSATTTPELYYAKRMICTACHQNFAPIFSRPLWSETNANPAVATRLRNARTDFYGVEIARGIDVPDAIDAATDRANLIGPLQQVWGEGCAAAGTAENTAGCRAALLNAALQLRLSGWRGFADDAGTPLATVRAAWQTRWPQGLAIPAADILNRDALGTMGTLGTEPAALPVAARVPADVDPLQPRTPFDVWRFDAEASLKPAIQGLAGFFTDADIRALDNALLNAGAQRPVIPHAAPCTFTAGTSGAVRRLDIACAAGQYNERIGVQARLYYAGAHFQRGVIDDLRLQSERFGDLQIASVAGDTENFRVVPQQHGLHLRRRNGQLIATLRFERAAAGDTGTVSIEQRDDYAPLRDALQTMTLQDPPAAAALGSVINRPAMLTALLPRLGADVPALCCTDAAALPPARVEHVARAGGPELVAAARTEDPRFFAALSALRRYCAPCHDSAETFPPNFLSGAPATVRANISQCAERLAFRLAMWDVPPAARAKTPMPPEHLTRTYGRPPQQWQTERDWLVLRHYIDELRDAGRSPDADHPQEYEQLPACLPQGG